MSTGEPNERRLLVTTVNAEEKAGLTLGGHLPRLNDAGEFEWDAAPKSTCSGKVVSDGGSSSYYELPSWASELRHLMEHKKMTPDQANIFKASYRLGEKGGTSLKYDLNKIMFFAKCMLESMQREKT